LGRTDRFPRGRAFEGNGIAANQALKAFADALERVQ
jgi:hypothetical protein